MEDDSDRNPFTTPTYAPSPVQGEQTGQLRNMMNYYDGGTYEDDYGGEMSDVTKASIYKDLEGMGINGEGEMSSPSMDGSENAAATPEVEEEEEEDLSMYYFWNLEYYRRYFNVNSQDVLKRMGRSFLPYPISFLEFVKNNPDAYGPFWVSTTVVFALAFAANIVPLIETPESAIFSFALIPMGFIIVYGYLLIASFTVWGLCKGPMEISDASLLAIFDLFGYGLTPMVPALLLCSYGWWWSRTFFLMLGTVISLAFLIANLIPVAQRKWKIGSPMLIGVAIVHGFLGFILISFFFYISLAGVPDIESLETVA